MTYIENFTERSDHYYTECSSGLMRLNRIIVSVENPDLASWTRSYLIPTAYSYWERFFRYTLEEFALAISVSGLNLAALNEVLLAKLKRREVKLIMDKLTLLQNNYLSNIDITKIKNDFTSLENLVNQFNVGNVFVSIPKDLVQTNSNVKYEVLRDNFKYFGLNTKSILEDFGNRGINLENRLNEFVDLRNNIGHGATMTPIKKDDWNSYIDLILSLMNLFQLTLLEALEGKGDHQIYNSQYIVASTVVVSAGLNGSTGLISPSATSSPVLDSDSTDSTLE